MANDIKVQDIIAKEAQYQLKNSLVLGNLVSRQHEAEFSNDVNGYKKGATIRVKKPENFIPGTGATLSVADAEEATTTVTVDKQLNKGLQFTSQELTLMLSGGQGARRIGETKIKPLMHAFANQIDSDLASLYNKVWNWAGTPGNRIDSYSDFFAGEQRLNELAVPLDGRNGFVSPDDHGGLVTSLQNQFDTSVARDALQRARLPMLGGSDVYMSQNVKTFTTGARGGTPVVNGGSQNVTYAASKATNEQSLVLSGASNSITGWAKAGDVFTIAGVYAVNPIGKDVLPFLQQFVVKADANSNGSGAVTLTISPAIITSGPYQNVSAAPANSAAITFLGSASTGYRQNMVFHKDAFHLCVVPLELPVGAAMAARINEDGLSVRVTSAYDITNDISTFRFDVLYGVTAIRPELATRLSGTA